jgi:outer membrane protein assembly factor BamD (BamD/ComL family)
MERARKLKWSMGLVGWAALLASEGPAWGGLATNVTLVMLERARAAQEQKYREQQILDRETDEWIAPSPESQPAAGDELWQARELLARGEHRQARKRLQAWLKQNPGHERYYDAVLLYGDAYFEGKDFYKAYEQYEQVVENTAGEPFRAALHRERDVALAFLSGQKRIVWRILRLPAYDEAITILDRIWERVPGTRLGEEALRTKADYYYNRGDMDLAQDEYALLAREFPTGRFTQFAMLRSAQAAEAAFPGVRFDDHPLLEADERYRQVLASYPGYAEREAVPERLEGIRAKRADKDLAIARWYQRTKQPGAAEFYYRLVIQDYPDTLAATDARQHLRALGVEVETEAPQP